MSGKYDHLLKEYPSVISKEQLYKILHISKRKATYLLEHGVIPCSDTGKKTRRFKVKITDVVSYLEKGSDKIVPNGIFSSKTKCSVEAKPVISKAELNKMIEEKLAEAPDTMTIAQIAKTLDYGRKTVDKWIRVGKIKAVRNYDGYIVPKMWLVEFLVESGYTL